MIAARELIDKWPAESQRLGLQGWSFDPRAVERDAELLNILKKADQSWAPYLKSINRFIPIRIWLRRHSNEAEVFSSASYPEILKTVFLTPLLYHHLPPNENSPDLEYAALENLSHEMTHQALGTAIRNHDAYISLADAHEDCLQIPWRAQKWNFDKAWHALTVYRLVAHLRKTRLKNSEKQKALLLQAENSARELRIILQAHAPRILSNPGRNLFQLLLNRSVEELYESANGVSYA